MYDLSRTPLFACFLPPTSRPGTATSRYYLPRCLRLYQGTSQEFLSRCSIWRAMCFVIGATATLSNSLLYPASSWARFAVPHTFPVHAHLSDSTYLASSCLIIRLSLPSS